MYFLTIGARSFNRNISFVDPGDKLMSKQKRRARRTSEEVNIHLLNHVEVQNTDKISIALAICFSLPYNHVYVDQREKKKNSI